MAEAERIEETGSGATKYRLGDLTLLAPVMRPGKIIAVGLNYPDHAIETKLEIMTPPNILAKFPSSINGHDAPVVLPVDDPQGDYEADWPWSSGVRQRQFRRMRLWTMWRDMCR